MQAGSLSDATILKQEEAGACILGSFKGGWIHEDQHSWHLPVDRRTGRPRTWGTVRSDGPEGPQGFRRWPPVDEAGLSRVRPRRGFGLPVTLLRPRRP